MRLRALIRSDPAAVWIPAGAFFLALSVRLVYLWQLKRSGLADYLRLDPLYYHDWAVSISRGTFISTDTYEMTPLYAYALAGLFKLFGYGLLLPRLAQAVMGAMTCGLVSLVGVKAFGRAEGILGGAALALYGPALFHESQIMKTVLTMTLSTATAAALYFSRGERKGYLLSGGALLGLTALAQENIIVALPFLLAWIAWLSRRHSWRGIASSLLLTLLGFVGAVAPATIRNYRVSGDFVLITSGGGEVFYTGNNEMASGHYRVPAFVRPDPFYEHEDFRAEAARRLGRPVTRKESDAFWWSEGIRFIKSHPGQYLALLWDKVATYFNAYERPDNYSYYNFQSFIPVLDLPLIRFGWLAPLGLVGIAISWRRWEELLPLHVTIGAYVFSALLFFTQDRYRMPMIPLLSLFAAHASVSVAAAAREARLARAATLVVAAAALALFIHRDPRNELAFEAQNHGILGEMHLHAGSPREAREEFSRTLRMLDGYAGDSAGPQHQRVISSAHLGIALALLSEGKSASQQDIIHHLRAAGASPDADTRRDALERLGLALSVRGDFAGAADVYRDAVETDPTGPGSFSRRLRLAEALHKSGRPHEALEAVQEARRVSAVPSQVELADAHYGEALIYMRDLQDAAQAARHLREVLRLNPAHPRAAWIRETLASMESVRPAE